MSLAKLPSWTPPPDLLGIVVARYNEPLDQWADLAPNVYLYAKYDTPQANDTVPHSSFRSYELLPNLGREGQTYCYHLYTNYDDLQPIMIFSQADPFDLIAPETNTTQQMVEQALAPPEPDFYPVTVFNYDLVHNLSDWEKINWTDPAEAYWITPSQLATLTYSPYPMSVFWRHLFHEEHPDVVTALHGGTFAVRREAILRHPRDFYKRCLDEFAYAGQNATNPEVGHFMERSWLAVWDRKFWLWNETNGSPRG
ncbi:uncharacterized protein BJX67DRAFT_36521 [Aspergillus lucknowensis]|uniref:Uncharacterized protein n=1 Tax=Aspergillus lucknowensis TaxID=176173 RepID=A0ABR4LW37_9EURO